VGDDPRVLAEALGQVRVVGQHRDPAVDVELGVLASVAAVLHGDLDQLFASFVDHLSHLLEQCSTLGEAELAQVLAADLSTPANGPRQRAGDRADVGELLLGRRVDERPSAPVTGLPRTLEIAVELGGHGAGPYRAD